MWSDSSFELGDTSYTDSAGKRVRVRSKRAAKFKAPAEVKPRNQTRTRKTSVEKPKTRRTGRRRAVVQSDSEEEFDREAEMEKLGEGKFSPIHDDFYGQSPKDDRPNNIEVLSLEDVKASV